MRGSDPGFRPAYRGVRAGPLLQRGLGEERSFRLGDRDKRIDRSSGHT